MTETYYSGDFYMTISNEPPMTNDGNTYCKFDLTKHKDSKWGCPVNQFGSMEEILSVLKGWREISNKPEFDCIMEINAPQRKMENDFISILEMKLEQGMK